jgi:hypothetical protein
LARLPNNSVKTDWESPAAYIKRPVPEGLTLAFEVCHPWFLCELAQQFLLTIAATGQRIHKTWARPMTLARFVIISLTNICIWLAAPWGAFGSNTLSLLFLMFWMCIIVGTLELVVASPSEYRNGVMDDDSILRFQLQIACGLLYLGSAIIYLAEAFAASSAA